MECSLQQKQRLNTPILVLFAIASGLSVANIYYAQPLLDSLARDIGISDAVSGLVITFTQIGYALGLFFLVPLGDLLNRRRLIITQLSMSVLALSAVAMASNFVVLLLAMISVGLLAVVVQVLVAFSATLAAPGESGKAVGIVTSGIVLGILLARSVSGFLTDLAGWRSVYFTSAIVTLLMAGILSRVLPGNQSKTTTTYSALLVSTLTLFFEEPVLRLRATFAFFIFAAFSTLWTPLVLPLSAPPFSFSHSLIGLFGLAGIVGALAAAHAGSWADRGYSQWTTGVALSLLLISWLPMSLIQNSLWFLVLGILILDFAVQAVHVTNQSVIFSLRPEAHSRLVAIYMIFYSLGSAVGSISSTTIYASFGWNGVCVLGAIFSGIALLIFAISTKIS